MKIPEFLICEDPHFYIRDDIDETQRIFIIHTQEPFIIAECFHFTQDEENISMLHKSKFNIYATLDYSPDEYIIIGALNSSTISHTQTDKLANIMRRMADWYEKYLLWLDDNDNPHLP